MTTRYWYLDFQEEIQALEPILRNVAKAYQQQGKQVFDDCCECEAKHCISFVYWWGVTEILKRTQGKVFSAQQMLTHMQRLLADTLAGHDRNWGLQHHSPETEDRLLIANQDILTILQEVIEEKTRKKASVEGNQ